MSTIERNLPSMPEVPTPSPFDEMAAAYDASFTHTPIGMLMRQAVWRRLDARYKAGDRILELNCGTGEDALYLARRGMQVHATDISVGMVEAARLKVEQAGLLDHITFQRLGLEDLAHLGVDSPKPGDRTSPEGAASSAPTCLAQAPTVLPDGMGGASGGRLAVGPCGASVLAPGKAELAGDVLSPGLAPFDGALSNFGGLNCVSDWSGVARGLAACLRPGAVALLCVMGPSCAWEWAWYLLKRRPDKAFRRLKRGGVVWRGLTIHYPSIRTLDRAFAPHFRRVRASAVGALVPPSYAGAWAERRPNLLAGLNGWERRFETLPLLRSLADHYLIEFERSVTPNE